MLFVCVGVYSEYTYIKVEIWYMDQIGRIYTANTSFETNSNWRFVCIRWRQLIDRPIHTNIYENICASLVLSFGDYDNVAMWK